MKQSSKITLFKYFRRWELTGAKSKDTQSINNISRNEFSEQVLSVSSYKILSKLEEDLNLYIL